MSVLIRVLLVALIVLPPLAMGAVAPWARETLFAAALGTLALWLLHRAIRGTASIARNWGWLWLVAVLGYLALQLVPLPRSLLSTLSPAAVATLDHAIPGSVEPRPISLEPDATASELRRLALLATVFFLVVNVSQRGRDIRRLVFCLIAIGTFEAIYGLIEQLTARQHIFWNVRQFHLHGVTGTYINKNHFAGLLEMLLPLALAVLLEAGNRSTARPKSGRESPLGSRLATLLSSPETWLHTTYLVGFLSMLVALFLSISRAGLVCGLVGLATFLLLAPRQSLDGRFVGKLAIIFGVTISLIWMADGSQLVSRLKNAVAADSHSLIDRVDLNRSGFEYASDFWLTGSGAGSFRHAFARFQSERFGNKVADFLHNDWLQMVCELGVAGALLLTFTLVWWLFACRRKVAPEGGERSLVTPGALAGLVAMLLHSTFDYNLGKITANGIVFAALLGLAYVCSHPYQKRRYVMARRRISRATLVPIAGASVIVAGLAITDAIPRVRADVLVNNALSESGRADRYHFLPLSRAGDEIIDLASFVDPKKAEHFYIQARDRVEHADRLLREAAESTIDTIFSDWADEKARETLVRTWIEELRPRFRDKRRPLLTEALRLATAGSARAPADVRLKALQGSIVQELEPDACNVLPQRVDDMVWLAPKKPSNLFAAGHLLASCSPPGNSPEADAKIRELFHRTLMGSARYAGRIYAILASRRTPTSELFELAPRTLTNYEQLYLHFESRSSWKDAYACLREIDKLVKRRIEFEESLSLTELASFSEATDELGDVMPRVGASTYERRALHRVRLVVSRRTERIASLLGLQDARSAAVTSFRKALATELEPVLERAVSLRSSGRHRDALDLYADVLRRDWSHAEAIIGWAEIASLPGFDESASPLELLLRLLMLDRDLTSEQSQRLDTVLVGLESSPDMHTPLYRLVRAAAHVYSGHLPQGMAELTALSEDHSLAVTAWPNRHLVWYVLGRGFERRGETENALTAYHEVLRQVPTHRLAWEQTRRLLPLAVSAAELEPPDIATDVEFGGRVRMLGYSLQSAPPTDADGGRRRYTLITNWELIESCRSGYQTIVRLLDRSDQVQVGRRRPLMLDHDTRSTRAVRSGERTAQRIELRTRKLEDVTSVRISISCDDLARPHRYLRSRVARPYFAGAAKPKRRQLAEAGE